MQKYSMDILKSRYLKPNESINSMFRRVAKTVAKSDIQEKDFFEAMQNLEFLPNSPCLMNAGNTDQLSACFVLPIEDSIPSIFKTLGMMASIHKSGGGTGFSFSKLRPKGSLISTSKGEASGPVSFMKIFDKTTEIIKQGGRRRGANMAVLDVHHPDIMEFITCKQAYPFTTFNISVAITDKFMDAVKKNKTYLLKDPYTRKRTKQNARAVFNAIVDSAWHTGDPGLLFIDRINKDHPLKEKVEATNPCGEVPLLDYESCNLGSINVSTCVIGDDIYWEKLEHLTRSGVNFLDNVIDKNNYPFPEIKKQTRLNRKIGLGIMGFADMLIRMKLPYGSEESLEVAERLIKFINKTAVDESKRLAKKYSPFPNYRKSRSREQRRNATLISMAPTGTISLIAETSSGIEPLFGVAYQRHALEGKLLLVVNEQFRKMIRPDKRMLDKIIKNKGSVKGIVRPYYAKLFLTAHEIDPLAQLKMQAVFQKYTDNSISKTINLRNSASKNDVANIFKQAYELGCKGVTVYRDKSKQQQVIVCEECR